MSLIPSLMAIGLAVATKNVIFSILCGCFAGVLLLASGNPFLAVKMLVGDFFFKQVQDSYNAGNIVLIIFIGGFIKLLENGGGAQSFAKYVHKVVDTPLKAQLGAWLGGILIFFSDFEVFFHYCWVSFSTKEINKLCFFHESFIFCWIIVQFICEICLATES